MADTLNLKLKEFKKALASLISALGERKNDLVRDSVIKRFEYTFELAWKSVKMFLREKYGADVFAPKECFRELKKNQMISDETTEKLLKMTDDRNAIIHTYDERFSNELYSKIAKQYRRLLEGIYDALKRKK